MKKKTARDLLTASARGEWLTHIPLFFSSLKLSMRAKIKTAGDLLSALTTLRSSSHSLARSLAKFVALNKDKTSVDEF